MRDAPLALAVAAARDALADLAALDAVHGDRLAREAVTEPPNEEAALWVRWCLSLLGLVSVLRDLLARAEEPDPPSPALLAESLRRAATAPGLVRRYLGELERLGDGRVTIAAPDVVNPQAGAPQNRDGGPTGQPGAGRLTPAAPSPSARVTFEHVGAA